jgi:hypothetical protein
VKHDRDWVLFQPSIPPFSFFHGRVIDDSFPRASLLGI